MVTCLLYAPDLVVNGRAQDEYAIRDLVVQGAKDVII